MNLNYELSDNVWWRPTYFSFTNREFLEGIKNHVSMAREFIEKKDIKNTALINDFEREYRLIYLKECLVGERNISDCTTQYIEKILEDASLISKIDEENIEKK